MIRIWHLSPLFYLQRHFFKNCYLPYASCGCFPARWQMSRLRMGSYDRSSDMSDDVGVHGVVLGVLSHLQMGVPTHELAFTRIANHLLSGMILQVVIEVVDVSIDHVLWIWLRITTDKYHVYQFLGDEHPFVSPFNVSTRATGFLESHPTFWPSDVHTFILGSGWCNQEYLGYDLHSNLHSDQSPQMMAIFQ